MRHLRAVIGLALLLVIAGGVMAAVGISGSPLVRTVTLGSAPTMMALDERSNRVFVGDAQDDTISVLDATTGALLATRQLYSLPLAMAIDERTGRLFVLSAYGVPGASVSMLDATNGALLSSVTIGHTATALAVDERTGRVFISNSSDNTVSVLDARSGHVLRTVAVGWYPNDVAVDERAGHVFTANYGRSSVSMLDAASGRVLRTIHLPQSPGSIFIDQGTSRAFVIAHDNGGLSLLDTKSGRLLPTIPRLWADTVTVDEHTNRVFIRGGVGSSSGPLQTLMLDARTGRLLGGAPGYNLPLLMWWNSATVNQQGGEVYMLSPGHVGILDGATGRLLRSLPTGPMPSAIAVDQRTSRAFVATVDPLRYGMGRYHVSTRAHGGMLETARQWLARLPLPWFSQPPENNRPQNGAVSVFTLAH